MATVRSCLSRLCLNWAKTFGQCKTAIVLSNCLRSQQEHGHPDYESDRHAFSEDRISGLST